MNKIKILYTIPNFDTAGSGKVLYDLAKGLDKEVFDVCIACGHTKGDFFKEVEALGLPVYSMPVTQPLKPYLTLPFRMRFYKKFLKEQKIDLVHSWHWSSDWSEVLACRMAGVKYIYTKKAMTWGNVHWKIRSLLSYFIITINEEMREYFPWKKNQVLIPLGLDTEYYTPELFKESSPTDIFKIITVANLVPVKGIEVLIKALQKVNLPHVRLEVLGDTRDPYAQDLMDLTEKLGLKDVVHFLGKHTDVRPFLANAHLYVIPTLDEGRKEGMPMALVEAMSMGLPVLGSDISGINFVLKDFPEYLFEAGNETELSQKIKDIIYMKQDRRHLIGSEMRQYVKSHFTLKKFIDNHQSLYQKIKGNGNS